MSASPQTSNLCAITSNEISSIVSHDYLHDRYAVRDEKKYIEGRQSVEISSRINDNEPSDGLQSFKSSKEWASKQCGSDPYPMESAGLRLARNWKPITLEYPALSSFIVISLSLVAILEVLYHFSSGDNGGGLSFGNKVDDISAIASFSYLYLPTVLAVLYSMLWNWIDLDVKRLEPWFQLSGSNGATAANSLLLHYPFEFLAFVPIRALRRRHWAVFYAGLITMVIFWAVTPIQSAIFTISTVSRTRQTKMIRTGSVVPISSQVTALNTNFMNTAYGVAWLDQKLPTYSTANYTLRPYAPINSNPGTLSTETWTAPTIAYGTSLNCQPAHVSFNNITSGYIFDNGAGCTTQELHLPQTVLNATFMTLYISYWDNAEDDWALTGPNCSIDQSHNFLALSASAAAAVSNVQGGEYKNLTALFCQPSYFQVLVNAEVNGTDLSVVSSNFSTDSSKIESLPDNFFNVTHFEYIIGTGISPISTRQDYQNMRVLEQYPRLSRYGLTWPVSNMVGFAVAASLASNNSIEDLANPLILQDAFEKAHKLMFSTAISTLTQPPTVNETLDGLLNDEPAAIVFVREFSIIVEASLSFVVLLTCALWYFIYHRPSRLISDPAASIADVMSLVRNSKEFSYLFQDDGTITAEVLEDRLRGKTFSLGLSENGKDIKLCVHSGRSASKAGGAEEVSPKNLTGFKKTSSFKTVRPMEMRLITGFVFIAFILGGIGLLITFDLRVTKDNGLTRPFESQLLLSFLENALPTAFASILEPFWVVLNRLLCLLRPFEDLRVGNARPSRTIQVQYTSLPPQLVFWRALRSRHLILATVCAVAISSNVLAVALSSLFNEAQAPIQTNIVLRQTYTPTLNGNLYITSGNTRRPVFYTDHFYVTMSNLTNSTSLPPWIDDTFFYLPFEIPPVLAQSDFLSSQGGSQLQSYAGSTRGFGAETICKPLHQNAPNNSIIFNASNNGSTVEFLTQHVLPNGDNITCASGDGGNLTTLMPDLVPEGAAAMEVVRIMSNITVDEGGFCQKLLVLGWARMGPRDLNGNLALSNGTNGRSFDFAFMSCSNHLLTAEFNVSVDSTGNILTAEQVNPFEDVEPFITTHSAGYLLGQINILNTPDPFNRNRWHNDSFTSDWMNSILKAYMNSSQLVDPKAPVPDMNATIPVVQAAYQRLIASIIGLNTQLFSPAPPGANVNVTATMVATRIFMSPVMFQISITILSLHLLTAILYYVHRPKRFLPRMPDTVASLIGYVSMSHAVEIVPGKKDRPSSRVSSDSKRYGFGRFIGVDGKPHVGIEEQSRLVPLQSTNPAARRRRWDLKAWREERVMSQTWI